MTSSFDTQDMSRDSVGLSSPAGVAFVIGLACFLTTGMVGLNPTLMSPTLEAALTRLSDLGIMRTVLGIAGLAATIAVGLRTGVLFRHRKMVLGLSAAYSLGVFLVYGVAALGCASLIPATIGALLLSMSYILVPFWFELLCFERVERALLFVSLAYALSFLFTLVLAELSLPMFTVIACSLPLASGALLCSLVHERPDIQAGETPVDARALLKIPLRPLLGTAVFGASLLLATFVSEQRYAVSTEHLSVCSSLIASIVLALVIGAAGFAGKRFRWTILYKLLLPILAACLLIIMIAEGGFQPYEVVALGTTWVFYRVITLAVWSTAVAESPAPACCVIAAAQGIQMILNKIASTVGGALEAGIGSGTAAMAFIVMAVIVAAVFLMGMPGIVVQPTRSEPDQSNQQAVENAYDRCVEKAAEAFGLSQRECELCRLVVEGLSTEDICSTCCIAPGTFKTHMRNIYGKAHVHSRAELVQAMWEC